MHWKVRTSVFCLALTFLFHKYLTSVYFIAWKKMFENGINKWNRIVAALLLTLMISLIINSYQQPVALFILMIIGYDISKIGDAFHEAK